MKSLTELYESFFSTYPTYQQFQPIKTFQELHDWLWKPESIIQMMDAVKFDRPAIEGVVLEIESLFGSKEDLTFTNDFTKKATGMLIKFVMGHFGYISSRQKDIRKGTGATWFTSGMHYEFQPEYEQLRIMTKPIIIQVDKQNQ